ncbi:MAG: hypothetical protein JXA04_05350 [Gammaproteobacteria bacterium]|nr:hypothetical protein [Gammaproteobacteria bacterium]
MENRLDLPYAQILLLRPHIAELVIFDGVELTAEMVREYQLILRERFSSPFGLLINKGNHYTYSFDAQMELGLDKTMKATAVLVERESSELIMRSIKNLPDHTEWNMNVFYEREHAIAWLEKQLQD